MTAVKPIYVRIYNWIYFPLMVWKHGRDYEPYCGQHCKKGCDYCWDGENQ